jgi:hypothetical protein
MQAAAASDDFHVCLDGRPPRQLSPRQTIRATADEISDAWRCCLGQARILRHHAYSPSVPLSGLPFLKGPPPVAEATITAYISPALGQGTAHTESSIENRSQSLNCVETVDCKLADRILKFGLILENS